MKSEKYTKSILVVITLSLVFAIFISIKKDSPDSKKQQFTSTEKAASIKTKCYENKMQQDVLTCYSRNFYNLALQEGYDEAFAVLRILQEQDPSSSNCHFIAHEIGHGSYRHDSRNWKSVLSRAETSCSYGVGHGLIEGYLASLPEGEVSQEKTLLDICGEKASLSCNHVVGHVLMVENKGDLNTALTKCGAYSELGKTSCQNGVFMEKVNPTTLVSHGLADKSLLNLSEQLYPLTSLCNNYEDKALMYICWGELAQPAFEKYGNDLKTALEYCKNAPYLPAAQLCRRRIIHILTVTKSLNLSDLKPYCKIKLSEDPNFEETCYKEIVYTAVRAFPDKRIPEVSGFCNSLDERFKPGCFRQLLNVLKEKTTHLETFCMYFPSNFQTLCEAENKSY